MKRYFDVSDIFKIVVIRPILHSTIRIYLVRLTRRDTYSKRTDIYIYILLLISHLKLRVLKNTFARVKYLSFQRRLHQIII